MKYSYPAGLVLAALSSSAFAAEPLKADTLVVTASRLQQPLDRALADVSVITREQIERSGATSLPALLQQLPGVEISQNGGLGSVSSIFLRGANSNQTVVLIDGVRVGSATTGGAALERLNLDQIERVEVLRGPSSSLYGADAIGGVVQLFTRKGSQMNAKVALGNKGYRELSAGLAGGSSTTRANVSISGVRTNGDSATNEHVAFGAFNADRDAYRNLGVAAAFSHEWVEGHDLTASINASRGETHFDGSFPEPASFDYLAKQRLESAQLTSTNQLAQGWRSRLQWGESKDRFETPYSNQTDLFETRQRQLSWQHDFTLSNGTFSVIADHLRQEVESSTHYVTSERTIKGVAAVLQQRQDAFSWQGSIRRDSNSQFGAHTSGGFGVGYQLAQGWQVRGGWATAFKAPTFNDLYWPGFSNPNLKPEKARNVDVAVDYRQGADRLGLTAYRNRVRDMIAIDPATFEIANLQRADLRGTTVEFGTKLAGLDVSGSLDWQRPENEQTGKWLPRRAKRHGALRVAGEAQGARWQVEWLASGQRFDDVANANRLGGYGLVNLGVDMPIAQDLTLGARLNNIADKRYELARGYNPQGRGGFISLNYQLK
ncbi:vitamin B12 transporter [Chitinivorax tropicus]|uniref:Vitamin B12 transporter n=1 Tax=Chitinivorax tropicus TaxID=714531 RepID=A0A840MTS9_9PROT|nr:TonB-dependent receptor [Chitinivorax tropicus]MBB5019776.1 vitamin B12 transporter [Chitinivorax tropicus]